MEQQQLSFYQVDSFSDHVFGGNPAGVVIFDGDIASWPDSELLLKIAQENNIAETVFCIKK
jgi:predicted PhzF superfamily epimerase YddE/YHI9